MWRLIFRPYNREDKLTIKHMTIDLGDKSKVVTYGQNGVTNCLTLCKTILKNYGLDGFGSSETAIQLLIESNGGLKYYGNNPQETYREAIECIDRHLNNGRPIIVGVNHTLGRGINEGATDHFVVIYGKGYDSNFDCNYYTYYEVGKSNISASYDNENNRLLYIDEERPSFYDFKSNRGDGKRFDVTQVRPNE
jgi:hypothetical protein